MLIVSLPVLVVMLSKPGQQNQRFQSKFVLRVIRSLPANKKSLIQRDAWKNIVNDIRKKSDARLSVNY